MEIKDLVREEQNIHQNVFQTFERLVGNIYKGNKTQSYKFSTKFQ